MILQQRILLLCELGNYMLGNDPAWKEVKQKASSQNAWFIPEFIDLAVKNIAENFLRKEMLEDWAERYHPARSREHSKNIGIVMAGNIPLVGFHDLLSVFISGHKAIVKTSSKDDVLIRHLVEKLKSWDPAANDLIVFSEILKNCDAYIATGSNNTSRYFEYYFARYPHIIRTNKTSVAILDGSESNNELESLADDVYQFFGLGCRNVTKIFVPAHYDFKPLLAAFEKYNYLADYHRYRNNYDYNLALHILNNRFYMTNGSILLVEDTSIFSPISQLNYEYYRDNNVLLSSLGDSSDLQCIIGHGHIPFGQAHRPGLLDYADKTDTMAFLNSL
jgi:hypothetical protein